MKKSKFNDSDFRVSSATCKTWFVPSCVEVAMDESQVAVRNSTDDSKLTVYFTKAEWKAFIAGAKKGEFDA